MVPGYVYQAEVQSHVVVVCVYSDGWTDTGAGCTVDSYGNALVHTKWPGRVPTMPAPPQEAEKPRPPDDVCKKPGMANAPFQFKSKHINRIFCAGKRRGYQSERWR